MDSGMLVLLIWVGVVFASIICTAAYFGGLGGAIKRWFSRTFVTRVGRTASVTPVDTLQLSKPPTVDFDKILQVLLLSCPKQEAVEVLAGAWERWWRRLSWWLSTHSLSMDL
ncbi:hypothetical protein POM88_052279 [Heracleum sosnowskyi]|uniref:Uncharacterized protein n=1 Tax=Heracleum sosnowskyi TaxID=360622 RepID=A0AAD8LZC6_9APIA|nr:hypothetical protein POM88_052279 [Heracleum sosnowskyi]